MHRMKKIMKVMFFVVGLLPIAVRASLDTKHIREVRSLPTMSAATASAATATAAQPAPVLDAKKEQERQIRKQYALVHPIAPCIGSPSEKIALFIQAAHQKNTKTLYSMMRDQSIKEYLKDAKNAEECNLAVLVDNEGKAVLEHAIENNDAQCVQVHARKLSNEQRQTALRYAADKERPRVLLALLPKESNESDEGALKRYFYGIQNLTMSEYTTYQAALALTKQYRKDHASLICSKILRALPFDAQTSVVEMLHPTLCIKSAGEIHDTLDQSAQEAMQKCAATVQLVPNREQDNALLNALNERRTGDYMQALEKGANPNVLGERELPIAFMALRHDSPIFLKMLIDTKKLDPQIVVKDDRGLACPLLFWAIDKKLPNHTKLLLDAGFDPNALNGMGDPIIAWSALNADPIFLKMLIATKGFNVNAMVNHKLVGSTSLLWYANKINQQEHARLLREAGAVSRSRWVNNRAVM